MKKHVKILLIVIIIITLIIAGIIAVRKFTNSTDDANNNNIIIKETEGLEIKAYISSGEDQLIVSAINKSGKMIGSGFINVSYYDEEGKKISVYSDDERYNMFENGSQIVFGFELPTENYSDYYIPFKTEVEMTIDEEYEKDFAMIISRYVDTFSYSYASKEEGSITLNVKNNGNTAEDAPRVISVVFYKNNKPIYSEEVNFYFESVKAGQTVSKEFDIPNDYKKSKETGTDVLIDYDSIRIYRVLEGNS